LVAEPAGAVQPNGHDGRLVSGTSPVPWTPNVQDGYVSAFAEMGDTIIVGGNFTGVRAPGSSTTITRRHLFAFQRSTGAISTVFVPTVNSEVTAIEPTGDGRTVWIAGGFTTLNGQSTSRLAKVDVTTGQKVTSFAPPSLNGRVHDIQLRGGRLFVEGRFTTVGGQPHTLVAAVDPTTGALDPAVKATFAAPRRGGALQAYATDVTPDGSRMVVVGNFTTVNGQGRYQIAMLDLTTNPVSVADWSTNRYGDGCSQSFDTYMRDVDISPDGSHFVVVTTGAYNTTYLCDVAARWETSATGSDLEPTWTNYSGGDTLTRVAVTNSAVYVGGHQRWMNNRYAGDQPGSGAVPREGLAALDPRSGATLSWNPGRVRAVGVYGFLATSSGLWIGSDTSTIAGQTRGRFALMPLNGVVLPAENVGALPGQVVSLGLDQGGSGADLDRTTRRTFTGSSVTGTPVTAAGTSDWSSVQGAFMVDGKLFTAWPDRTFKVQDYDGATFGPQTDVPLALAGTSSLNRFATEDLSTVSAMFYDRASGRLFFTKDGSSRLYHRSFSPESRVVGGERFSSDTDAGGVSWDNVETMFLAGGQLYTSSSNGNLTRRTWNATTGLPVAGTATTVSGPAIDGQDWRAQDAFLYAGTEVPPPPPNVAPTASFTSSCVGSDCLFNSSASSDTDGTIVARSWDWGDGSPAGTGTSPSHTYADVGTYAVTLTVTDDDGATGTTIRQVEITPPPPNVAPTASFTQACSGTTCQFNSSASSDTDGTIVARSWDWGDGSPAGTGTSPSHTYADVGTYAVTLTVTDDDGATGTTTRQVQVLPAPVEVVEFRAAAGSNANTVSAAVTVPASVQPGDVLLLAGTFNSATTTVGNPAGWTRVAGGASTGAGMQSYLWTRTAAAGDAGTVVRVTTSSYAKTSLQVAAYANSSGVLSQGFTFSTTTSASRTTPLVNAATSGSGLVSIWADKGSASSWTVPAAATLRNQTTGSPSGQITSALADSTQVGPGTVGGLTATANATGTKAVTWSILLAPG
jgi:PKD repeat protein